MNQSTEGPQEVAPAVAAAEAVVEVTYIEENFRYQVERTVRFTGTAAQVMAAERAYFKVSAPEPKPRPQ